MCAQAYHAHKPPPMPPRLLSLLLSSSSPNLLQLAEVFTLPQQLAQWLHVLLAEATAREPAGGGERVGAGVLSHSDRLYPAHLGWGLTQAWSLWNYPAFTTSTFPHSRSHLAPTCSLWGGGSQSGKLLRCKFWEPSPDPLNQKLQG